MRFQLIGGDRRQEILVTLLTRAGHTATCAFDTGDLLCDADLLILPIPATRDGVLVTGTAIELSALPRGVPVAGGNLPDGVPGFDYLKDEIFTEENACLTADGVMRMLYDGSGTAPCDERYAILGYGRIGRALVTRLIACGARVTVEARKAEARSDAVRAGADAIPFGEPIPGDCGVVVNTVPPPFDMPAIPAGCRVMDLCSVGEGAFPPDVRYISAPGLPGRFFPESAAMALYRATIRYFDGRIHI